MEMQLYYISRSQIRYIIDLHSTKYSSLLNQLSVSEIMSSKLPLRSVNQIAGGCNQKKGYHWPYRVVIHNYYVHDKKFYCGRYNYSAFTQIYMERTDGNIMYLTDASRFLISCVIQHYAPVVGWGEVEEQMHNVYYDPGP